VITVNSGIDLRPGLVQMSVIYPASPLCSPASDYQTTSPTQLDISPRSSVLYLTDNDSQEVTGSCCKFFYKNVINKCLIVVILAFLGTYNHSTGLLRYDMMLYLKTQLFFSLCVCIVFKYQNVMHCL